MQYHRTGVDVQDEYAVCIGTSIEHKTHDWEEAQDMFNRECEKMAKRPRHLRSTVTMKSRQIGDWVEVESSIHPCGSSMGSAPVPAQPGPMDDERFDHYA
jgi:hypothetical protein